MLSPVRTVAPTDTPVSVDQAKIHCGVEHVDHDDLFEVLVSAATDHLDGVKGILGRGIVSQTWRQDYEAFESPLRLPLNGVTSITSVTYYDSDNAQQTLATSVYELLTDEEGPYVELKPGQSWPATYNRTVAVSVTFVAGVTPENVPAPIKNAILMMVNFWYENRAAASSTSMSEMPFAVHAMLGPYRKIVV